MAVVEIFPNRSYSWRCDDCGAKLSGAKLAGADLSGAILDNADLADADLAVANLGRAMLSFGRLAGANLAGANLESLAVPDSGSSPEDLRPALGLTQDQLDKACADPFDPPRLRGTVGQDNCPLEWRGAPCSRSGG